MFANCPPPIVDQLNMVEGFMGQATVESFYAPMACEDCDERMEHLFTAAVCRQLGGKLPAISCPACGQNMEVDDLEEQYLLFLRES